MKNTITIKGKEYKVKYTLRALFIFESITNKPFKIETLLDNYIFFYALLLANNEDIIEWDEFINALDENPKIYEQMNNIIIENQKVEELLNGSEEDKDGEQKKN